MQIMHSSKHLKKKSSSAFETTLTVHSLSAQPDYFVLRVGIEVPSALPEHSPVYCM